MTQPVKNKQKRVPKIPEGKRTSKTPDRSRKGFNRFVIPAILLVILLITWFTLNNSLNLQFTNWDDDVYILDNKPVHDISPKTAIFFFTHPSASNYHPLTMISLAIDYNFAKESGPLSSSGKEINAYIFHRTNLIFHLLNVVLVFLFIYLLTTRRLFAAAAVALLFAIHPMHVESVSWISERKDVLYAFFFLSGLITYLKYLEEKKVIWFFLTFILFILSLLSKPSAVIFPLVLFAVDYYRKRQFGWKAVLEKVVLFIPAVIFGLATVMIQSKNAIADFRTFTIFQRLLFFSYGSVMYIYKLLVPLNISSFYPYPHLNNAGYLPFIFYISPLILMVLITGILVLARYTRTIPFGMAFFFLSIILVLQFVSVGTALMADRYTYISSIGLFFIIGFYTDQVSRSKQGILSGFKIPVILILSVYIIILAVLSHNQVKIWQNSETLWTDVIKKYPDVEIAYKNRGNYYATLNLTDQALADNMVLVSLKSKDPGVYRNLGNIYGLKGETDKALEAYSRSISIDSGNYETYLNRAITFARVRRFPNALADFEKALSLKPGAIEVFQNRSYALLDMGEFRKSLEDYNILISHEQPNDANYLNRGLCLYRLGRISEALADFRSCIALNPGNGNGLFNIAVILDSRKDFRGALDYAEKARQAGYPVNPAFEEKLRKQN